MSNVYIQRLAPFAVQPKWDIPLDFEQPLDLVYVTKEEDEHVTAVIGYIAPGTQIDYTNPKIDKLVNVCVTRRYHLARGKVNKSEKAKDAPLELITLGDLVDWSGNDWDEAVMLIVPSQMDNKGDDWKGTLKGRHAMMIRDTLLPLMEQNSVVRLEALYDSTHDNAALVSVSPFIGSVHDVDLTNISLPLHEMFARGKYSVKVKATLTTVIDITVAGEDGEEHFIFPAFV